MENLDIFFYEIFEEEKDMFLKYLPKNIRAGFSDKTVQESIYKTLPSNVISIRTQSIIDERWYSDIRAVITRSTGYDHVIDICKDIKIGYLPLYCSRSVAEHAMMLWICLLKKTKKQINNFKNFNRDGITGNECFGKNLLVVGVGNIGYEICKIAFGLNMNIRGVDISEKYDFIEYTSIEKGMEWADIIVCSMNLTEKNDGYFNKELFQISGKKQIFINVSRGGFVSSVTLLNMIEEGFLDGVGIDVYDDEPSIFSALRGGLYSDDIDEIYAVRKMMDREDCILTPHNAFNTEESTYRKVIQTVEQLNEYLMTGEFKWGIPKENFNQ